MAKLFIEDTSLVAIGDAIRSKVGGGVTEQDFMVLKTQNTTSMTEYSGEVEHVAGEAANYYYVATIPGAVRVEAAFAYQLSSGMVLFCAAGAHDASTFPSTPTAAKFTPTSEIYENSRTYENNSVTFRLLVSASTTVYDVYGFYAQVTGYDSDGNVIKVQVGEEPKTYSPAEMAEAIRTLPTGSGGITPEGEIVITDNGIWDVTEYASANIQVPTGGGDGDNVMDEYLSGTLLNYENNRVTYLDQGAFCYNVPLRSVKMDNVKDIGARCFYSIVNLHTIDFKNCETIGGYAFYGCVYLSNVNLPKLTTIADYGLYSINSYNTEPIEELNFPYLTTIGQHAFRLGNIKKIDLGACTSIANHAFRSCAGLEALIIRTPSKCENGGSYVLKDSPIGKGNGYIYVPKSLLVSYQTDTNWSSFSSQIRAIEDYPEICG